MTVRRGPQAPGLPKLPNNTDSSNGAQKPANPSNVDVSDKSCVLIDGVPTIIPPTGLVLQGSHDTGLPCWMAFGVNPR